MGIMRANDVSPYTDARNVHHFSELILYGTVFKRIVTSEMVCQNIADAARK